MNDIKHQKYYWQPKTVKNEINLHIQGQNKIISLHFDMKMYQINHLLHAIKNVIHKNRLALNNNFIYMYISLY